MWGLEFRALGLGFRASLVCTFGLDPAGFGSPGRRL